MKIQARQLKIPQSVRKRDNKVKTLPKSNNELNRSENLEKEYQKIYIPNLGELLNTEIDTTELQKTRY